MQSDLGKLFVGGISWDTNEERLREYFSGYGEVLEAVIIKDHTTGRARGFGFVVFADPAVADRVTKEKHNIDGRTVEAKKAVPRDDQTMMSRNSSNVRGSRTRKIFVGGLASTVTETDFRRYFEQFGTINDVVVMYDHNTKRPRGFGFITYDSDDAVDNVLLKTFHELNGKMVEVKRAVPKELSPGLNRSPYGLGYPQGPYSPGAVGGYGVRMDGRFSPIPTGRSGFASFGSGYGMGLNFEPGMTGAGYSRTLGYGRGMDPYLGGSSNRFASPMGFDGGSTSFFSSTPRNLWGNGGFSYGSNSTGFVGSGILGNAGLNWGSSPIASHGAGNSSALGGGGGLGYGGGGDHGYGLGGSVYGRNMTASRASNSGYEGPFSDIYGGDPTWRSGNSERDGSGSFGGYGVANDGADVQAKPSPGYGVAKRQPNRGIAG